MEFARHPRRPPGGARALLLTAALAALPRCARPARAQGDTARTALPPGFARGVSYAHDWSQRGVRGYGTESDRAELARVRAMGATWVSVMPFGYLPGPTSTALRTSYDRPGAERDEALRATIRRAHALGLRVLLKPHLWVSGSWPGAVDPPREEDAAALVDAWGALTLHYAALAAQEGVAALTLGVEMDRLARRAPARWRAMITAVRGRYRGTLTYAAGWSDVEGIPFWDALDVIGVDHYAPLAGVEGPVAVEAVEAAARSSLQRYATLSERVGRPVWLTELGFRRDARALVEPWAWVAQSHAPEMDLQSLGYAATLRALRGVPCVQGVFAWKWFSSGGDEDEGSRGFAFEHRPAEGVLREAFVAR
jgi:hypothetical protein